LSPERMRLVASTPKKRAIKSQCRMSSKPRFSLFRPRYGRYVGWVPFAYRAPPTFAALRSGQAARKLLDKVAVHLLEFDLAPPYSTAQYPSASRSPTVHMDDGKPLGGFDSLVRAYHQNWA
jgi:hypothetical protein